MSQAFLKFFRHLIQCHIIILTLRKKQKYIYIIKSLKLLMIKNTFLLSKGMWYYEGGFADDSVTSWHVNSDEWNYYWQQFSIPITTNSKFNNTFEEVPYYITCTHLLLKHLHNIFVLLVNHCFFLTLWSSEIIIYIAYYLLALLFYIQYYCYQYLDACFFLCHFLCFEFRSS